MTEEQVINEIGELHQMIDDFQSQDSSYKKLNDQLQAEITERKQIEAELRKSEERFRDFFEKTPIGLHIFGPDQTIIDINDAELDMIGYSREEIVGKKSWQDIIISAQRGKFQKHWDDIITKGQVRDIEYTLVHKKGYHIDVILNASSRFNENGNLINTRGSVLNITEHKQAQGKLQKQSHDLGERIKELNCLYGLSELVEKHASLEEIFQGTAELIPPGWQYPEITCGRITALGNEFKSGNFEQTEWKQSSEIFITNQPSGRIEVFYKQQRPEQDEGPFLKEERNLINALAERLSRVIERKLTGKQVLEYQKQLQQMGLKMAMAEDHQRREIAAILHDNIGQDLALSVLKLDAIKKSITSKDTAAELDEIHKTIEKTIQETRTLSFELSSPTLYRFGFTRAIEQWLSEQVQKKYGIKTKFIKDRRVKQLDEETCVVLYQATREVLINVIKHAQAKFVEVSVNQIDGKIEVIVEDDGVGFEISEIGQFIHKNGGFGLFNVRERLNYFGGDIRIKSKPENGTRVMLTIPAKAEKTNRGN